MNKKRNIAREMLDFIADSPSVYHVIENAKKRLSKQGFMELKENDAWEIKPSQGYFVIRNGSSMIAFYVPGEAFRGFHVVAGHSDSPTFKIKENMEMAVEEKYIRLNTEKYGGMILSTWMDRPLSVAGRIVVRCPKNEPEVCLVNVDKDLLVIPNLAIHMNRDVNKGYEYNPQTDLLPIMALGGKEDGKKGLLHQIAASAKVDVEDILAHDLFLYVRETGRIFGANKEFILSPKLDDLQCVYTALSGFLDAKPKEYTNVLAIFDNEEVGSATMQGADSTFLQDVLMRISEAQGWGHGEYCRKIANSFLISADNAHALHPNHPQKADPTNRPCIGEGIVIKYHGSQRYTTDAVSAAKLKLLCEKAKVPFQIYTNRSDIVGGSTLGNISTAHVSMASADIGLPQLAMHSAVETAGVQDTEAAVKLFGAFYKE